MAGNFYGADVAQLRQLAKDLAGGANRLNALGQQLGSSISSTAWRGHDGERFRNEWTSAHQKLLQSATAGLEEASKALLANADEQEKASTSGDSGGGGGGTGGGTGTAQDLTHTLNGMTPEERSEYLRSEEFQQWALANPDAAKAAMDAAADSGLIDKDSEEYADFLSSY